MISNIEHKTNHLPHRFPPDNNLVWAILSTIFCCLPLGIVSIIKAAEVNDKWSMGDYEGAYRSARQAGNWALYSVLAFVIIIFLIAVFVLLIPYLFFGTFTAASFLRGMTL